MKKILNRTCQKCGTIDSFQEIKKMLMTFMECTECKDFITPEELEKQQSIANPRCPNTKCDNHKSPPSAKLGFVISVVEEGFLGKIFKSEAYGIVSCKKCGEIIGVGGKG